MRRFELRPSVRLAVLLVIGHVAAAASAYAGLPGWPGAALALALLAVGAVAVWSRALLRAPDAVCAVEASADGTQIELARGARLDVVLGERRYVSRWLVLLPLRSPMRRTILITADMLTPESFRLLRLWALWGRVPPVGAQALVGACGSD